MSQVNPPVSIGNFRVFQLEPNLTAILPGVCQARCRFCLEPEGPKPKSIAGWVTAFRSLMEQLPPLFRLLSISGGEPSLSPVFGELLEILRPLRESGRLKRVVLTTNGGVNSLPKHLEALGSAVTHVNISRHAVDDALNAHVFETSRVPSGRELATLIEQLNQRGLPVNLNCVYSAEEAFGRRLFKVSLSELQADAHQFIHFAQDIGASSVTFRHDHRDPHLNQPTALETAFDEVKTVYEARCDSCRVVSKLIFGLAVNFKRSAFEPLTFHGQGELYELVFYSDGLLYRDWSRLHPISMPLPHAVPTADWERLQASRSDYSGHAAAECDQKQQTCNLMRIV